MPLELLQKVIKYPLEQIACGIRELHTMPFLIYNFATDPIWIYLYIRKFIFIFLSVYHLWFLFPWKSIQPYHTPLKADIIWCGGTFKVACEEFLPNLSCVSSDTGHFLWKLYNICLRQKRQLLSFSSPKVFTRFCVWVSQVTLQTFTSEKGVCCLISSAESPPPPPTSGKY